MCALRSPVSQHGCKLGRPGLADTCLGDRGVSASLRPLYYTSVKARSRRGPRHHRAEHAGCHPLSLRRQRVWRAVCALGPGRGVQPRPGGWGSDRRVHYLGAKDAGPQQGDGPPRPPWRRTLGSGVGRALFSIQCPEQHAHVLLRMRQAVWFEAGARHRSTKGLRPGCDAMPNRGVTLTNRRRYSMIHLLERAACLRARCARHRHVAARDRSMLLDRSRFVPALASRTKAAARTGCLGLLCPQARHTHRPSRAYRHLGRAVVGPDHSSTQPRALLRRPRGGDDNGSSPLLSVSPASPPAPARTVRLGRRRGRPGADHQR
jgi:hypothetical protein